MKPISMSELEKAFKAVGEQLRKDFPDGLPGILAIPPRLECGCLDDPRALNTLNHQRHQLQAAIRESFLTPLLAAIDTIKNKINSKHH